MMYPLPQYYSRASTIKEKAWENARMILVGTKCDLTESRAVSPEEGQEIAESLGVQYFETSAKDNINIKQTFEALVDEISEKMAESIEKNPNFNRKGTRQRNSESTPTSSGGCGC